MSFSALRRIAYLIVILIAGCAPLSENAPSDELGRIINEDVTNTPDIQLVDDEQIQFSVNGVELTISLPDSWEFYETEFGIVLAEYLSSVASAGQLEGLLAHIYVPALEDFTQQALAAENEALVILEQIIKNPEYIGEAAVSEPIPFVWDGQDAAYYLMDSGENLLTVVIGVIAPDNGRLVAASISAPPAQVERIREALPTLLDQVIINGKALDGDFLDELPTDLSFPMRGG